MRAYTTLVCTDVERGPGLIGQVACKGDHGEHLANKLTLLRTNKAKFAVTSDDPIIGKLVNGEIQEPKLPRNCPKLLSLGPNYDVPPRTEESAEEMIRRRLKRGNKTRINRLCLFQPVLKSLSDLPHFSATL